MSVLNVALQVVDDQLTTESLATRFLQHCSLAARLTTDRTWLADNCQPPINEKNERHHPSHALGVGPGFLSAGIMFSPHSQVTYAL